MQLYTSDCNCKGGGNIPRSHFVKNHFKSSVTFFMMSVSSQKHHSFSADFIRRNRSKSVGGGSGEYGACCNVSVFLKDLTAVLEHCPEREKTVASPLFRAFPFDCIPKAKRDVNVHFFIHSSSSCKL